MVLGEIVVPWFTASPSNLTYYLFPTGLCARMCFVLCCSDEMLLRIEFTLRPCVQQLQSPGVTVYYSHILSSLIVYALLPLLFSPKPPCSAGTLPCFGN